jgi:mRNA interferase MazF
VQGDAFNASRLATVVVVPLTSKSALGSLARQHQPSGPSNRLPKDSVANVSQMVTVDRSILSERVGRLTESDAALILSGIDLVLGRG